MIAQNIESLRARIGETCRRVGRNPEDVLLVAVSKTFEARKIAEAVAAGQFDFGENYVQELNAKRAQVSDPRIRWHFIGHLQTNKVKYIADFVHLIHSVDNLRVAEEIQKRAGQAGRVVDVLIEVHTTDEETKSGVRPGGVGELVRSMAGLDRVRVRGLMTMGPFSENPEDSRASFRQLAELAQAVDREGMEHASMRELSMGMSHDFEVALEEGATILRIGTAIFGERKKNE